MGFVGSSILAQDQGTPFFLENSTETTPGSLKTLISYTVPASNTLNLKKVIVTCRHAGVFYIKKDGDVIGSGRIGPSEMNVEFPFDPSRNIDESEQLVIEFIGRVGSPASDIEAYLQASLI